MASQNQVGRGNAPSLLKAAKSITFSGVSKSWGNSVALDNIDIHVEAGSFTALLGPSGCGKSTALRLISGLEEATSGTIYFDDLEVSHLSPSQRDIAMVFQNYALFPHLSVGENIVFGLKVRGVGRSERDQKLKYASDMLGLSQLLDRKPSQLSGGQQQRVALGRAIVAEKSIFLMDEPLSNLDAKLRHEMREEIEALQKKLGVTMVYVTHDQVEAITMADQIILMNMGKVEQATSPRDIYNNPGTSFAAKFIGTPPMNIFSADALEASKPKQINNLDAGIRPEDLAIQANGKLKATIDRVEYLGADALVECILSNDNKIVCRVSGDQILEVGSQILLAYQEDRLHYFDKLSGTRVAEH